MRLIAPMAEAIFWRYFQYDIPNLKFGRCRLSRDLADATCSTAMSFIAREGLSEIFDNFCLDAISINSLFVRFKVSLLADNQVYTLLRS